VAVTSPELLRAAAELGARMIEKVDEGWLSCLSWSTMVKLMVLRDSLALPDKRLHEGEKREASSRVEVEQRGWTKPGSPFPRRQPHHENRSTP
jgi:hypothetical protein